MNNLANLFKTGLLFAALTALLIVVGYLIGGRGGAIGFFVISLIMNLVSFWFSDKIALSMSGAQPLEENQAPEIYSDVRDLVQRINMPMPRIYMSGEMQPNAFATGRNQSKGVICVTQGLVKMLNRSEVRAVLAHELGHIKNNDVLISTMAAVIAGTISSIANMAMWFGTSSDSENRNPIGMLLMVILAPIAASLIHLAISRTREYAADRSAAEATREPRELANALIKIESAAKQIPMHVNPALSSLYISNPFKGNLLMELFSTHPSTENRIRKLTEMPGYRA